MDYTVAPVLLLLAVIVPTKTLQASLIMRYTAENTAMHNNVPRKGGRDGQGATLCSGRHKRKVLLAHLTTRPRKWLIKLGGSLCTVSGHTGKGASLLSAKA